MCCLWRRLPDLFLRGRSQTHVPQNPLQQPATDASRLSQGRTRRWIQVGRHSDQTIFGTVRLFRKKVLPNFAFQFSMFSVSE